MRLAILTCATLLGTTTALAHDGVKNPAVMARMHSMKTSGAQAKVLGEMAKGRTAFDAVAVEAALTAIAAEAARTVTLFEDEEDDPKSEARAAIWAEFDDFTSKANALEAVIAEIEDLSTLHALRSVMPRLAEACGACHKVYRD